MKSETGILLQLHKELTEKKNCLVKQLDIYDKRETFCHGKLIDLAASQQDELRYWHGQMVAANKAATHLREAIAKITASIRELRGAYINVDYGRKRRDYKIDPK